MAPASNYVVGVVLACGVIFLIAFATACGIRLCRRRKTQAASDDQTTQNVAYPEAAIQRSSYEPHYREDNADQSRALRDRYYFNFQGLETHPFETRPAPSEHHGPVVAVVAEGTAGAAMEPYVGTLVFDGDVVGRRGRRRDRDPMSYGEAVYVTREDSTSCHEVQQGRK